MITIVLDCDKTFTVNSNTPIDVLSEGYSSGNYVPTQLIKCTYTFTADTRLRITFDAGNVFGNGASLKVSLFEKCSIGSDKIESSSFSIYTIFSLFAIRQIRQLSRMVKVY